MSERRPDDEWCRVTDMKAGKSEEAECHETPTVAVAALEST